MKSVTTIDGNKHQIDDLFMKVPKKAYTNNYSSMAFLMLYHKEDFQ